MTKIGAVINDSAGTLPPQQAKQRLEEIKQHLENRVSPGCLVVVPGHQIDEEVKRMKGQGIDVLMIGGGDGTISTAAKALCDTELILAVIALGTRNHFAHDLGVPLEPLEAIRLLDRLHVQKIDLGEVNGHTFLNNATIGFYPKIVQEREEKTQKHGWRKWIAHIMASFLVLWRLPRMKVTVEGDGFKARRYTPFLFVGNNEYQGVFSTGSSRETLRDGKLWLCMSQQSCPRSLLRLAWQLSTKGVGGAENLETHLLAAVTVKRRKKGITVAIDGENYKLGTPLRFKIRRKCLRVVVP